MSQKSKKIIDWTELGAFLATVVDLYTVIRNTFTKLGVGIGIIPWLVGEGKEVFVKEFLEPLGKRFSETQRVKVIDEYTIRVNLGASPKLPFEGATVVAHEGEGWVEVQKRSDGLYIDGRKVVLHLSERQHGKSWIIGNELRDELTHEPTLNANVLDALFKHPHLIPGDWKKDDQGRTRFIYFWATIYRDSDGGLYVRCLYWDGGQWDRSFHWLGGGWGDRRPAAVLASSDLGT